MENLFEVHYLNDDELVMPERSELYHLLPMTDKYQTSIEQASRECLTSYLQRLAKAHNVLPTTLDETYFTSKNNIKVRKSYRIILKKPALNGLCVATRLMVSKLEELTKVKKLSALTLLNLTGHVNSQKLLVKIHQWCPLCFNEMRDRGEVYSKLIWNLDCYQVCHIHQVKLIRQCACNKTKTRNKLNPLNLPHICGACGVDLSILPPYLEKGSPELLSDALKIARFFNGGALDHLPNKSQFSLFIKRVIDRCAQGKCAWLANYLGIGKSLLHGWMRGIHLPSFPNICHIAMKLDCELKDIFNANVSLISVKIDGPSKYLQKSTVRFHDHEKIKLRLFAVINNNENIPVRALAKEIGIDVQYLRRCQPELIRQIVEKKRQRLALLDIIKKQQTEIMFRKGFEKLLSEGLKPTRRNFEKTLGLSGIIYRRKLSGLFNELKEEYFS